MSKLMQRKAGTRHINLFLQPCSLAHLVSARTFLNRQKRKNSGRPKFGCEKKAEPVARQRWLARHRRRLAFNQQNLAVNCQQLAANRQQLASNCRQLACNRPPRA